MNDEQHLTYELGITNVPSDATCDDNGLEDCIGLTYGDGEHRVVQGPVCQREVTGTLLFVHKIPGGERENDIVLDGGYVKWVNTKTTPTTTPTICDGDSNTKVVAIGNTLIVNTGGITYYALWKVDKYISLGNRLPEVEMQFKMSEAQAEIYYDYSAGEDKAREEIIYGTKTVGISSGDGCIIDSHNEYNEYLHTTWWWHELKRQADFNEAMKGIVLAHLNNVKGKSRFCFPFFVRYAILLYDGTYTNISNPILMMPTVHYNRDAYFSTDEMMHRLPSQGTGATIWTATYNPYYSKLNYKITSPIPEGWNDIVKGIGIFVSEEVRTFNLEGNWTLINPDSDEHKGMTPALYEAIGLNGNAKHEYIDQTDNERDRINYRYTTYIMPTQWTDVEFAERLKKASVFYKLFELNGAGTASADWVDATDVIDSTTLENLANQEQLGKDDYFSHTDMSANIMKTFNSRLHLADINRGFFDGFSHFSNAIIRHEDTDTPSTYTFAVYISADDGERIVRKSVSTFEDFRVWFFYPDPRAKKVEVYNETSRKVFTLTLKEHESLNGAYAFVGLPYGPSITETAYTTPIPIPSNEAERIVNRIFVSEVNNPWVFDAKGDVMVGNTKIKGMASQTMALGQEEHGLHPLTVFTEDGIYGIVQNSEGVYMKSDVFSREICNNAKSIIETDGAVFFASEKGLMVVVGSEVKCVSEQLSGKFTGSKLGVYGQESGGLAAVNQDFATFMKTAFIAYDYRDSLLWLFDGATQGGVTGSRYCWIYNIKNGTFARYDFGTSDNSPVIVKNVVSDYPDYLLQIDSDIYSLLQRPDINADGRTYSASVITRALKLGGGMTLKSIMRMKNVFDIHTGGTLSVELWAKNNLNDEWVQLTHLRGTPHKYYQLRYTLGDLKATDRFAGTVMITQERRTNKLR